MKLTEKQKMDLLKVASIIKDNIRKDGTNSFVIEEIEFLINVGQDILGNTVSISAYTPSSIANRILTALTKESLSIAGIYNYLNNSVSKQQIESELTNLVSNGLVSEVNGKRVTKYTKL